VLRLTREGNATMKRINSRSPFGMALLAMLSVIGLLMAIPPSGVTFYPYTPRSGGRTRAGSGGTTASLTPRKREWTAAEAAAASATGVHAAVTDTGVQQVVTTGITNPPAPRNITATAGGTAADIKAIAVTIAGTNEAGEAITEVLPVFTEDTAGIVTGAKAFATVTSITIPAHDGTGATTAIGFGDKLGLPDYLSDAADVGYASFGGVKETTAPTVVADADELEKNTVDLNTALNGTAVDVVYFA
jgi:hypothetical protein